MTSAERKHLSFEREPDLFVLAGSARGLLSRRATVDCKNRRIQKYTRVCTVCVLPYGRRGYVIREKFEDCLLDRDTIAFCSDRCFFSSFNRYFCINPKEKISHTH